MHEFNSPMQERRKKKKDLSVTTKYGEKYFSAKEVEACEILNALRNALKFGFSRIHAVSDALEEVVNVLNGDEYCWCISNFVKDILEMSELFVAVFSIVSRMADRAARIHAKFSFVHKESFKWVGSFPSWFADIDCLMSLFLLMNLISFLRKKKKKKRD